MKKDKKSMLRKMVEELSKISGREIPIEVIKSLDEIEKGKDKKNEGNSNR